MSSSQIKSNLKAARECIAQKDYKKALEITKKILSFEPGNYNAQVFAGVSLLNLGVYDESEKAYQEAIQLNPANALAWQGLVNLFEKTGDLQKLKDASFSLADIYLQSNDEEKCFSVIDKYIKEVKSRGSQSQINEALGLLLPDNPYFALIERLVPPPGEICEFIAVSLETLEQEAIDKEIAKRRMRLGANLEQVTKDVKREVLLRSELESIYQKVIDWTDNIEIRRTYESKLLRHSYETLMVSPPQNKEARRGAVWQIAHGMVVLNLPDELAWTICVDWKDFEYIEMYGLVFINDLIRTIPQSGLARVLSTYLKSELCKFPRETSEDDVEGEEPPEEANIPSDELLGDMMDGHNLNRSCITSGRILASYLLYLKDYEAASEIARASMDSLQKLRQDVGISLVGPDISLRVLLGASLIHYQAPKHHPQAQQLFDDVLSKKPNSVEALLGKGRVALEEGNLAGAIDFTARALQLAHGNVEAKMEHAWALVLNNDVQEGKSELQEALHLVDGKDARSRELISEIWWRLGKCLWSEENDESRNKAYTAFVTSLKYNHNYAPAYTSLGIFYANVANDSERAYRCFQKAFELDAGEAEAAERLAHDFADSRQWDLVEVVAHRFLQAARKRVSTKRELSWPHRALGVAKLNERNYAKAIQSFQAALRNSPRDVHAWIGLGEAYANSGRYSAALKSFARAETLDQDNWFAQYILGMVQRDVLEYDLACETFRKIIRGHPDDFVVALSLAQTLIAWAYSSLRSGYMSKSVELATQGVVTALHLIDDNEELSEAWKIVGDGAYLASLVRVEGSIHLANILSQRLLPAQGPRSLDGVTEEETLDKEEGGGSSSIRLLWYNHAAMETMVILTRGDRLAHSGANFNLGLAKYQLSAATAGFVESSIRPVIECFKKAIQSEPRNFEYWNALGVATATHFPTIAEKAFSRALWINERSSATWTNLGIMYLIHDDEELAMQAFSRGQAADPENAVAWVGQAIVAIRDQDIREARDLYQHAFEIGERSFATANFRFAEAVFDRLSSQEISPLVLPSTAVFALKTYIIQRPNDKHALHIFSMLSEREGQYEPASQSLRQVSDILEQEYEDSEDEDILRQFCIVKSDLGRIYLALGDYTGAVEQSFTALDLSQDLSDLTNVRLSSHLIGGLSHYFSGDMETAISMFQNALTESDEDVDVMLLVGQALWATGGSQEREVALQQIRDCLKKDPTHMGALCALASINLALGDKHDLPSVLTTLRELSTSSHNAAEMHTLLTAIARLEGRKIEDVSRTEIMLDPSLSREWINLSKGGDPVANMALKLAARDPQVSIEEMALAYEISGSLGSLQSGILLSPWRAQGWRKLNKL